LRAYVRDRVDALVDACAGAAEVDFVAALARPTPSWVVAHYLGVPLEDRARFDEWTHAIVSSTGDVGGALTSLYGYFTELVTRRRREGATGDDLVSILLRADDDGAGIGLEGVLGYAFVMIAGATTPPPGCSPVPSTCSPRTPTSAARWSTTRPGSRARSRSCCD
jgi:cytochrome P450